MDSLSIAFILFLITGVLIGTCQPSNCHAQCDYDPVTARADCTSRNLNCIPVNYPDSLAMDLSNNNISVLEPGDFNGSFSSLVELYLDYNAISDVTSLLQSTGLGSLKKLSIEHNVVSSLPGSCSLSALEDISLDYDSIDILYRIPSCNNLEKFSINYNEIKRVGQPLFYFFEGFFSPAFISMRFNRIRYFRWNAYNRQRISNVTFLLDYNEITLAQIGLSDRSDPSDFAIGLLSLSHNSLQRIEAILPTKLVISNSRLSDFSGFDFFPREETSLKELDIRNNSFDSLIQPDWARGLQILYADDNILANLSATTLQGFINLTELHLANNRLLFISSTALRQLTMLRSLYLDGNALTSLFGGIFLNQDELVELSITNNQLSELHPDYFLGLDSLERLYIAGNRLVYVHSEMFWQMPGLTTMDFSHNELQVFDATNCNLVNLQNLLLSHNAIINTSLILGHCNHLVVLDLSFNQIEVVPGDSLTGGNRALSRLELEGNPLQCDCRLAGSWEWLRNNPPSVLPRCQAPPKNSGAVLTHLEIQDFNCDPPKAMTSMNQLNVVVGQTVTVSCTATGIPSPIITWLDTNGTVLPDKSQDRYFISRANTLYIISVELSDKGMYTCLVQNVLDETDKAIANVTVTEELKAEPTGVSWAATVLPTMFITLIVTIALIIFLRRYQKKYHSTSAVKGVRGVPRLTIGFHKTEPTRPDDGYVNETVEGEYMTPSAGKEGTGEKYEVPTTSAVHPPGRYQRHLKVITTAKTDDADFYEPVNIGGQR